MTNANRKNQIPLSDKMLSVLATLRESVPNAVTLNDPGDYSSALALIRRGCAVAAPVKMSNGANANAFRITLAGMAVLANRRAEELVEVAYGVD
jgi:hypothetical protein